MLTDLRTGKLDVSLMGKLTADLAVRGRGLTLVGEGLDTQQFAIVVPKGSSLVEPLNAALLAVESDGRFAELSKLYLSETPAPAAATASGAVVTILPVPTPAPVQPAVTACVNSMKWIADLNLDDQNMQTPPALLPGQDFVKKGVCRTTARARGPWIFELAYANGNCIEAAMGGRSVRISLGRTAGRAD